MVVNWFTQTPLTKLPSEASTSRTLSIYQSIDRYLTHEYPLCTSSIRSLNFDSLAVNQKYVVHTIAKCTNCTFSYPPIFYYTININSTEPDTSRYAWSGFWAVLKGLLTSIAHMGHQLFPLPNAQFSIVLSDLTSFRMRSHLHIYQKHSTLDFYAQHYCMILALYATNRSQEHFWNALNCIPKTNKRHFRNVEIASEQI